MQQTAENNNENNGPESKYSLAQSEIQEYHTFLVILYLLNLFPNC